jgi:hypothetical protein
MEVKCSYATRIPAGGYLTLAAFGQNGFFATMVASLSPFLNGFTDRPATGLLLSFGEVFVTGVCAHTP